MQAALFVGLPVGQWAVVERQSRSRLSRQLPPLGSKALSLAYAFCRTFDISCGYASQPPPKSANFLGFLGKITDSFSLLFVCADCCVDTPGAFVRFGEPFLRNCPAKPDY